MTLWTISVVTKKATFKSKLLIYIVKKEGQFNILNQNYEFEHNLTVGIEIPSCLSYPII